MKALYLYVIISLKAVVFDVFLDFLDQKRVFFDLKSIVFGLIGCFLGLISHVKTAKTVSFWGFLGRFLCQVYRNVSLVPWCSYSAA